MCRLHGGPFCFWKDVSTGLHFFFATSFLPFKKSLCQGHDQNTLTTRFFSSRKRCIGFLELGTKASVFSSITSSRQACIVKGNESFIIIPCLKKVEEGAFSVTTSIAYWKKLTYNRFSRLLKAIKPWLILSDGYFWMISPAFTLRKPAQETPSPFVTTFYVHKSNPNYHSVGLCDIF